MTKSTLAPFFLIHGVYCSIGMGLVDHAVLESVRGWCELLILWFVFGSTCEVDCALFTIGGSHCL